MYEIEALNKYKWVPGGPYSDHPIQFNAQRVVLVSGGDDPRI